MIEDKRVPVILLHETYGSETAQSQTPNFTLVSLVAIFRMKKSGSNLESCVLRD